MMDNIEKIYKLTTAKDIEELNDFIIKANKCFYEIIDFAHNGFCFVIIYKDYE